MTPEDAPLPELGVIEGFYGRTWTWPERAETLRFLAPHGYRFWVYAPKGDPFLRRRWREPHPEDAARALADFARTCREAGVRLGVGLSPLEAHLAFDPATRAALDAKLAFFDELGIDDLAVLFDDMRGDVPGLAERQVEIAHHAAARTRASRVLVCPSYYSDDPVLDRVFGARPEGYVERLGALLDPAIEVFWTGEEVCSRELSVGHLERVGGELRRRPFLWDNYPVNDGQRLSEYLHLRGFTGRPAGIALHIAAHGVNPALQPTLTRIPALTLVDSYRLGDAYEYGASFRRAAQEVAGEALASKLRDDLLILQDVGLGRLGEREGVLRERYGSETHSAAREVIQWLDGAYRITDEVVQTQ